MHSGADVEAFQAALNRDIGGDASNSQLSDSDAGIHQFTLYLSSGYHICKMGINSYELVNFTPFAFLH